MKKEQQFPPGWNEKKVRELIQYYDNQTEEEAAAEIEAADEAPGETWMSVPTELVPAIARLIENHQQRNRNKKTLRRSATKARAGRRQRATPRSP